MIYRIVCDGVDIYGDTVETAVLKPHLEIELNSAGSLEFTLPPDNEDAWNMIKVFRNEIEVWENDEIIWFGRPLQITRDWNNQKKVVCEGALAYFNDTIERTNEIFPNQQHTNTIHSFFRHLIDSYNSQIEIDSGQYVSSGNNFEVGEVTIPNVDVYRSTDYQTTFDCLQQMCLDTNGGYFILRKVYNEEGSQKPFTRYIDWYEDLPYGSDQDVEFGINLLDFSHDLNGADICTVLIPTGADNLKLNELGNKDPYAEANRGVGHKSGSDEIWYEPGVEVYGRVVGQQSFSDYSSKETLWNKARDWLVDKNTDIPTIEVDAADLHYIKEYSEFKGNFKVGMNVQVISGPHDMNQSLVIYKLSMDLDTGTKKVTLGTPPKKELTDIVAPSSGGKSTRGSGGDTHEVISKTEKLIPAPGGGSPIMVKRPGSDHYSSAVENGVARIDLTNAGKVMDILVDGESVIDPSTGIASIANPVVDVKVNGESVVNQDRIAGISVPVRGVVYNGIDVVDPETGIASISSSLDIGELTEIDFYSWERERDKGVTIPRLRTVTISEPGVYIAILRFNAPSKYSDLTVTGATTLFKRSLAEESYQFYTTWQITNAGKILIFSVANGSTATVTFDTSNYRFVGVSNVQVGVDKPQENGWYNWYPADQLFAPSPDVYALQGVSYFKKVEGGKRDYIEKVPNVQVGVDKPQENGWLSYNYEDYGSGHHYVLRYSTDEYAVGGVEYYREVEDADYSDKVPFQANVQQILKIDKFDSSYLTYIDEINEFDTPTKTISTSNVVPNTKDIFFVFGWATSPYDLIDKRDESYLVEGSNRYFYGLSENDPNLSTHFLQVPSTRKRIIHYGDPDCPAKNDIVTSWTLLENMDRSSQTPPYPYYEGSIVTSDNGSYRREWFNTTPGGQYSTYEFQYYANQSVYYAGIDSGTSYNNDGIVRINASMSGVLGTYSRYMGCFRISQPIGVLDVTHNNQSIVDLNGVAEIGDVAYKSDVADVQTTLQTNFQAGVDSVYDACVSKGSTPASHSLTDVVNGILAIPQGGGGGGVEITSIAEEISLPRAYLNVNVNAEATITTIAEEVQ